MLTKISSLLGRRMAMTKEPRRTGARPTNRARIGLERLETRDSPSALSFLSPAAVYGGAALNGSVSAGLRSLTSFNSGNIAHKVGSGLQHSESYASLSDYSGASSFKNVTATSSAFTTNHDSSTAALAMTADSRGNYAYATVHVSATNGEHNGQRVRVTLNASFVSTIGNFNTGYAVNSYSFYVNGQQFLGGNDSTKGIHTFSRTVTVNTTIGANFQIAFQAYSSASGQAGNNQLCYNVANNNFSLDMSVRTL
jgi:hypothetical protein